VSRVDPALAFTGAASGHELSHAAFYADCQHEVGPVRSGFRLCLTYDVTLVESAGPHGAVGRDLVKVMPHGQGYVCPQVARHFCPVGIRREKTAPVKTL